ncbi:MAG: hypothetical protein AABW48_04025 [Nanoarchaeota archaeon]
MVDQEKAQADIELIKKEIETIFAELTVIDQQRLEATGKSFKNGFKFNKNELQPDSTVSNSLLTFSTLTKQSLSLLNKFEKSFLKIVAYVLLIKQGGHKDPQFQDLFRRYKIMEKFLKQLYKEQKKQIKRVNSILGALNSKFNFIPLKIRYQMLLFSLNEENRLKLLIASIYGNSKETIDRLDSILEKEKFKKKVVLAIAGIA